MKAVAISVILLLVGWINAEIIQRKRYKRYQPLVDCCDCNAATKLFLAAIKNIDTKLTQCLRQGHVENDCKCINVPRNCKEILKCGCSTSGVYSVDPDGKGLFKVYCDQTTKGGGWTVIQRRKDGSVDFYQGWNDYKEGFGNLKGELWLGLDKIHRLTHQTRNRLRVELDDFTGKTNTAFAEYDNFVVSNEKNLYKLTTLGSYSGTAGDSLNYHKGFSFSTKDRDHDKSSGNCAVQYKGAWWYNDCHHSNLNGYYYHGAHKTYADGVDWKAWRGYHYSAKTAEMKIRPI